MIAEFTRHLTPTSPLQVLAQAYGTDAYGSNSYNGQPTTMTTTPPLPPNTGLHLPSSPTDIALLLVIAVMVGSLSYALSRLMRRRRAGK